MPGVRGSRLSRHRRSAGVTAEAVYVIYNSPALSRPTGLSLSIRRRVAAVGGIGDHLLEGGAHRHVEIDALGRDRLEEPLVVDRVDLAALVDVAHGAIDHLLEGRIVA